MGRWIDTLYALLSLIPVGLIAGLAMPGLMGGGLMVLFSAGIWNTIKGGALSIVSIVLLLVASLVMLWLWSIQWMSVATHGASLGKRAVGVRMVDESGQQVGFYRGVFLRRWMWSLMLWSPPVIANALLMPTLGSILSVLSMIVEIVNALYIFTPQRRTLCDLFAGTSVVSAIPNPNFRAGAIVGVPSLAVVGIAGLTVYESVPAVRSAVASVGRGVRSAFTSPSSSAVSSTQAPSTGDWTDTSPAPPAADPVPPAPTPPPAPVEPPAPVAPVAPVETVAPSEPVPVADAPIEDTRSLTRKRLTTYVDGEGVAHIVESLGEVPPKYRAKAKQP